MTATVAQATPAKRKRGKSLSRRTGQSGHIEASGRWFVVRFWKDIEGQEKRALVRERICPISGPGYMNRSERERRAKEIIAESRVDTAEHFNRTVKQQFGVTFKEQSKIWLQQSQSRKRKPIRATTVPTIQAALDKWILPELGHLPLSETAKYPPMKSLVAKLNAAGLSAQTVNAYFRMAKAVVESAEDAEGNPLYDRKWDAEKLDLPVVETSKQRRPSITADVMAEFAQTKKPKYRMVFILAAASGCRIGEILGLEIKDVLDDFTTIRVVQQAKGTKLTMDLKTINSQRFVDICPEVAALLKEFLGGRTSGLVFLSRRGTPLNPSNLRRRVIHPLLEKKGLPLGGNHIFRRFRLTWLRENSVPGDIERFWFGHANQSVGDDYSMLRKNVKLRKEIADRIGVGFKLPESILAPVVPNVPKMAVKTEEEVLA
ncbi:MAG: tyrosine-type recombinase/integrase [Candidatus Acidiferrum sp.]